MFHASICGSSKCYITAWPTSLLNLQSRHLTRLHTLFCWNSEKNKWSIEYNTFFLIVLRTTLDISRCVKTGQTWKKIMHLNLGDKLVNQKIKTCPSVCFILLLVQSFYMTVTFNSTDANFWINLHACRGSHWAKDCNGLFVPQSWDIIEFLVAAKWKLI